MADQINKFSQNDTLYDIVSNGAYNLYKDLTNWDGWKKTLMEILEI